jgi:hypothetical protein
MTQDEIIEMARQAHFDSKTWVDIFADNPTVGDVRNYLIAFAKLIERRTLSMDNPHLRIALDAAQDKARKDEREACAEICDYEADDFTEGDWDTCCNYLAKKIRARGEQA